MPPGFTMGGQSPGLLDSSLLELAFYGLFLLVFLILGLLMMALATLPIFFAALGVLEVVLRVVQNMPDPVGKFSKIAGLVFRGLRRNLLRTSLTYAALFVLTGMLTAIYSMVWFLGKVTEEKESNLQVIMTEKFSIPSQMPPGYANQLKAIIETKLDPSDRPADLSQNFMTWSFVGGSLDPAKFTQENGMFMFCLEPTAVLTMMNDQGLNAEDLGEEGYQQLVTAIDLVKKDKRNIIVGQDRLKILGKQVGDEIKLYGLNYKDIEFDFRIVASFPPGSRYGQSAAMRADYLEAKLDEYKAKKGAAHPQADRCINLIWVRLPTKAAYEKLAAIVNSSATFSAPQVKLETASAGISSFLDAFKDIFWGMKFIIMPAIMVIMGLVVATTTTIGVRERRGEMAVMKVLGFVPWQITTMIVAEAVLIGLFGSLLSTWSVYFLPQLVKSSGVKFQVAFFNSFKAPVDIVIYGPLLGVMVGLIGALLPAASVRKVKVSEVFAKIS
ncbi:hypothetical protein BH11PLA2_BH11PLA2_07250 [soil metagenome]